MAHCDLRPFGRYGSTTHRQRSRRDVEDNAVAVTSCLPAGEQEWQPTLFDATAADYELTVYQNVDGVNTLVTPPYVASDTAYEIRVRALKGENVDKQFSLGIAYTPKWDPSGSSLLLINMQSGATNWTGSESTEKIVIKQVDIPTN